MNTHPVQPKTVEANDDQMREESIAYLDRRIRLLQRELEQTRRYTVESGDLEAVARSRVLRVRIQQAAERLRRLLGGERPAP